MADLLRLYHALPYPFKVLAASARGCQLRRWRYGPDTERLVEEALERETWSTARWKSWQEERLAQVLERAATRVPYYRSQWNARRRAGDRASWEVLANWPILDKEAVRQTPRAFVADDCDISKMFHEHTSGTTGKPLDLWWSRDTVQAWYALFEARWRCWHGVSRADRWAILGGQLVTAVKQNRPPFWVWNQGLRQLYLSTYHLSPQNIPAYVQAINRYQVSYLWGYSSALFELAVGVLHAGLEIKGIQVAISNAEPLWDYQRETIGRAFRCQVRDTYGMAEIVSAASECCQNRMHLWPEVGFLEVLNIYNEDALPDGETGRFIATGLINPDQPLIRYLVGDSGALTVQNEACGCGRSLPLLRAVEGRLDDVLVTAEGRRVGRMDPVFKVDLHIQEAQIIQQTLERVKVLVVPAEGYSYTDAEKIAGQITLRLGRVQVEVETVSKIPRAKNGKFKSVVSLIPIDAPSNSPPILPGFDN